MPPSSKKRDSRTAKPELLAPAGAIDVFFAALEQGADAVYVGTDRFNARLRARNFSMDELARMVAYAHGIGRKVHVTLNTLVKQQELPALVDTLTELRRIRPDALIIQELGVYRLARRLAPEIPLHASTQMTIHNAEGARQAQEMGFSRAILAREMTLEEIRATRKAADIELETFVHGAMCYSVSGQCSFSSYVHGKSANRGRCLQPCRRLYDLGEKRMPFFAPLDLNAAPILFQLIAAGIFCFKIEGRLKPAETIAQVVAAYRLLIDAYPTITKEAVAEAKERLRLAIGRKQSTGFYLSAAPDAGMVGEGMSRSGRYLGKAKACEEDTFQLRTREVVKVGDRLTVQKGRHAPPRGFNVKQLAAKGRPVKRSRPNEVITVSVPFPVEEGAAVVMSIDGDAVTSEAKDHDAKKWPQATERAKAAFPASFRYDMNGAVVLEARVADETVSVEEWPSFETYTETDEALALLGSKDTERPVCLDVEGTADFPDGVPMTTAELAALRDRALQGVVSRMDASREAALNELVKRAPGPQEDTENDHALAKVRSLGDAAAVLKIRHASAVVPLGEAGKEPFEGWWDDVGEASRVVVELPTFQFDHKDAREYMQVSLKKVVGLGVRRFMVSNLAHFPMLDPYRKHGIDIIADDPFHCLNSHCAEELAALGARQAVFAQEGDRETLRDLVRHMGADGVAVQVYGKVPLFRSRQPHPKGVRSVTSVVESNEQLNVVRRDGLTCVVPERDFSLRHCLPWLHELGLHSFLYDFSYHRLPPREIRRVLTAKHDFDPRTESSMNYERGLE